MSPLEVGFKGKTRDPDIGRKPEKSINYAISCQFGEEFACVSEVPKLNGTNGSKTFVGFT